uniref:hypothetical protein n=1 Tax=Candidatus Enterovibrio escicola TaxID=1927127 RepID=UPI0018F1FCF0|nr:hypothetical protein [Candidatus Enterovibrio escacola]
MMIVIAFYQSGYRDLKTYYIHFIYRYFTNKISKLVSIHTNAQAHARCSGSVLLLPHTPSGKADRDCFR